MQTGPWHCVASEIAWIYVAQKLGCPFHLWTICNYVT